MQHVWRIYTAFLVLKDYFYLKKRKKKYVRGAAYMEEPFLLT